MSFGSQIVPECTMTAPFPSRRLAPVAVLSGVVGLTLAVAGLVPRWHHDVALARFERSAAAIPVAGGRVVGTASRFGLLWGAGNHCDAQVWVAVDSAEEPAVFREALPSPLGLDPPFPSGGDVTLWDATDPERPLYVRDDGSGIALDANRQVPGTDRVLEASEREALVALARSRPVAAGRHLYLLEAASQSYAALDLLDRRCH
jgi:hypothetical protein